MRLTDVLSSTAVCSASRAALLTGCYPKRVGLHKGVLFPDSMIGLNPDEYTIADHMKSQGYVTACFGKSIHSSSGHSFRTSAFIVFLRAGWGRGPWVQRSK